MGTSHVEILHFPLPVYAGVHRLSDPVPLGM
jgi:hypothetical protein